MKLTIAMDLTVPDHWTVAEVRTHAEKAFAGAGFDTDLMVEKAVEKAADHCLVTRAMHEERVEISPDCALVVTAQP